MPFLKEPKFESKKIRQAAKGQTCTLNVPGVCRQDKSTVVLCHLSTRRKGTGNKSPDLVAVDGCNRCHDWLDGRAFRGIAEQERDTIILKALKETLMRRINQNLITLP